LTGITSDFMIILRQEEPDSPGYVIRVGGIDMLVLLGSMIHWRKAILLDIRDETLKQAAYAAMLALIHPRQAKSVAPENHKGVFHQWLKKNSRP
jgi:hypothetical protein